MNENIDLKGHDQRKTYSRPEITHELELETRAGSSPLGMPDPMDLSGGNE